jgi:hypothetical protein
MIFELIRYEIEFHSDSMSTEDLNVAFLLSLADSDELPELKHAQSDWYENGRSVCKSHSY